MSAADAAPRTLTRASAPDSIEDDLAMLWLDAARESPIARALMANLVVYCDCPDTQDVDLSKPLADVPVDDVLRKHPSRMIRLHHGDNERASAPVDAAIAIVIFGDGDARFGVEEIAIRSTCAEQSLPSIVRHLARGDVPTSVWWTEDLSRSAPLEALISMGRQLLYDSRGWSDPRAGVLALAPFAAKNDGPDLADVNWTRLAPMRLALAHAVRGLKDTRSVALRVEHRADDRCIAWLLAGWLASKLGWASVSVAERSDAGLAVSIDGELTATMDAGRVLVEYRTGVPPLSIAVPRRSEADIIAAELRNLTYDSSLRDTLAALAARLTSSQSI